MESFLSLRSATLAFRVTLQRDNGKLRLELVTRDDPASLNNRRMMAQLANIYAEAEDTARAAQAGLWRDAAPVSPWEFRHSK